MVFCVNNGSRKCKKPLDAQAKKFQIKAASFLASFYSFIRYSFFSVRARSSPAERMEIASPCLNDATAKFNVQEQTTTQMKKIAAFLTSTMNTTNNLLQNLKTIPKFQSMFMSSSRIFSQLFFLTKLLSIFSMVYFVKNCN